MNLRNFDINSISRIPTKFCNRKPSK